MDKENYEAYEYLSETTENDHFFVVQSNGTFMITRQPVEYVGESNKDTLEAVQVFNVAEQQFLVDVNNSSELISVSDEFIIPARENNLYTNSYILQPECTTPAEPMDEDPSQDVVGEFKQADSHINLDIVAQTSKQANSCTEITITDEQYQMLEQKGWILLELNDKIYILDTLGLHDITSNHKLIKKLKDGEDIENIQIDNGNLKLVGGTMKNEIQSLVTEENPQFVIENNIVVEAEAANPSLNINNDDDNYTEHKVADISVCNPDNDMEPPNIITSSEIATDKVCKQDDNESNTRVLVIENEDICRVGNTLKVKTKLSLKDFPDKIVLGKTVNGKNLIAKVVQPASGYHYDLTNSEKPDNNPYNDVSNIPRIHLNNNNLLNEAEFHLLMQHFFQNNIKKCNAEDIVSADSIIAQLLQIPTFVSSVIDNNLIITKTVQTEDCTGNATNKGLSALVTGKVTLVSNQWRFVHLPNMLQKMVSDTKEFFSKCKKGEILRKEDYDVLHVQISEAKQAVTDIARVSVTVNKRNIPIHLITNKSKQQSNTMYACSFCASVFKTELELKDHQATHALKQETMLSIDMDHLSKPSDYYVIHSGKTKSYACTQCDAKFTRLATCKNHLKTHYVAVDSKDKSDIESNSNKSGAIYKCNMCPSAYFHPSTLSKHIVAKHIKIRNDK